MNTIYPFAFISEFSFKSNMGELRKLAFFFMDSTHGPKDKMKALKEGIFDV